MPPQEEMAPARPAQLTIGLPVYNGGTRLSQAIRSVTSQTMRDFIVVVSDNASTDDTPAQLRAWASRDERVRILRQSVNIGPIGNFGAVLSAATTPYFIFIAHDDVWEPNYLQSLWAVINEPPGHDYAVPVVVNTMPDGSVRARVPPPRLQGFSPHQRRVAALTGCDPGWFYGLFRTERLRHAFAALDRFEFVWSWDFVVLAPILISGSMATSEEANFFKIREPRSEVLYRPKAGTGRARHLWQFLKLALAAANAAPISMIDKCRLLPALLRFADKRALRFRKLPKALLQHLLSRRG